MHNWTVTLNNAPDCRTVG